MRMMWMVRRLLHEHGVHGMRRWHSGVVHAVVAEQRVRLLDLHDQSFVVLVRGVWWTTGSSSSVHWWRGTHHGRETLWSAVHGEGRAKVIVVVVVVVVVVRWRKALQGWLLLLLLLSWTESRGKSRGGIQRSITTTTATDRSRRWRRKQIVLRVAIDGMLLLWLLLLPRLRSHVPLNVLQGAHFGAGDRHWPWELMHSEHSTAAVTGVVDTSLDGRWRGRCWRCPDSWVQGDSLKVVIVVGGDVSQA